MEEKRGLRALYDWFVKTPPDAGADSNPSSGDHPGVVPERIGQYQITRKLGEGGMGVVYAATDPRLERSVALKTMKALAAASSTGGDDGARKRFWREARAAASVNHPNICQIYEIGEDGSQLFIAMELLDGESLSERLGRGSLSVAEAVPIGLSILSALSALHARGIVHRDLKPSNVFLTPHGVKLLDFGLARPDVGAGPLGEFDGLTRTGIAMGTPRYMSPEQIEGEPVDPRSDVFAAAAILFEMIAGRPAFVGRNAVEVLHATLHEQPPALSGSPAVAAVDRVIRRALAKRPEDRLPSADTMAAELRAIRGVAREDTPAATQTLTRLMVLPFRVLRPDTETDFLAFSLPDAISTSLSGIGSLVVRSSAIAARFAGDTPDLKAVAAEADVDRVVTGTLLRAGDQLRVVAQLVEAPAGTLVTAHTVQASLGDLFGLQDDIAKGIVGALALPLGGATPSPAPDAPRDARAYELYLRANEAGRTYQGLPAARVLYEQCLELDSRFAPAWARLGRCHRVIGKFLEADPQSRERAEQAFKRALEINSRLTLAHKYYANLEADLGHAERAMVRLLQEAGRHGNDPELFAGLVHACRYCGLYDDSVSAHDEARRLDPNVPTSVEQTALMMCDIDRLMSYAPALFVAGADPGIRVIALGLAGRHEEARAALLGAPLTAEIASFKVWTDYLLAWLERRKDDMLQGTMSLVNLTINEDPEAMFQDGWLLCDVGAYDRGIARLREAVDRGYAPVPTLLRAKQFDPVRNAPEFEAVLNRAEGLRQSALAAFRAAGGERLFGG